MWSPVSSWGRHLLVENRRECDGMKMIFWTWRLRRYLDWRSLLDLSIFCFIKCRYYQNIEMDNKESAISNSDRDRRQRRLREIKTKGMKKIQMSTQRLLSAKITIAMWIYSWSSRYCRNWTESLFEAPKRIEEAKWSWTACWSSWWEIVSEIQNHLEH